MFAHAQAPVRVGIAGGGTDLPAWTRERVGRCLSLAIRVHTHAVAISRPDGQVVASYRKRDVSPMATEIANGLIRESALLHGWESGFEVHTLSELSSRGSGLGVSSSIAVALAACFRRMAHMARVPEGGVAEPWLLFGGESAHRMSVARDAWTVEIDKLKRPIGRQDHMAAAHGGLRLYSFVRDAAEIERSFSKEDADWLARQILLVRLPEGHDSRAILSRVKSVDALEAAAAAVPIAVRAIEGRDPGLLGEAVARGQASKRAMMGAVPAWLAGILEKIASVGGVCGCKVAGAGGGGHVVVARAHSDLAVAEAIEAATGLSTSRVEADLTGVRSGGWM
jgi:D-glycero-alpha-D-manno-heptose-7-phosphate kinase